VAAELAYYWVRPDLRRRGLGRQIFFSPIRKFIALSKETTFVFTTAMGVSAGSQIGKCLLSYLLEQEKKKNGLLPDGRVRVSSIKVSWEDIKRSVGIEKSSFMVREESFATKVLAEQYDMQFLGFSKNLSPTFGTINCREHPVSQENEEIKNSGFDGR
jgi:hypothetical protein